MIARDYQHPDDLLTLQRLVERTWTIDSRWHVGGLAWDRLQHVGREPEWPTRIWEERGQVVAWAWVRLPGELDFCVDPRIGQALDEALDWFESRADGDELTVTVARPEPRLEERGYRPVADERQFTVRLIRELTDVEEPRVPEGYLLRHIRGEEDLERRVEVHRAAFAPSRVNAESYRNVTAAWPYRPELDVVVEAPDGSFAAFCLAWIDKENRVGELEPVGTHPDHRRRGLAAAVCSAALGALRAVDTELAVVNARGDAAYPIPKRLYESIGFREHARETTFVRTRSSS